MQTTEQIQDAAPASAKDNNLVPEPARSGEEIVPLQRLARLLAESWRRRAEIYAATEGQVGENIQATYRICAVELAALVAETGKQPSGACPPDAHPR